MCVILKMCSVGDLVDMFSISWVWLIILLCVVFYRFISIVMVGCDLDSEIVRIFLQCVGLVELMNSVLMLGCGVCVMCVSVGVKLIGV